MGDMVRFGERFIGLLAIGLVVAAVGLLVLLAVRLLH